MHCLLAKLGGLEGELMVATAAGRAEVVDAQLSDATPAFSVSAVGTESSNSLTTVGSFTDTLPDGRARMGKLAARPA